MFSLKLFRNRIYKQRSDFISENLHHISQSLTSSEIFNSEEASFNSQNHVAKTNKQQCSQILSKILQKLMISHQETL